MWAVEQTTGRYKVSYIGETARSFYSRTKEHIIQTLGGNYRIVDSDQMRQGVQQIVWDGLWRRDARDRLPQFLGRYESLAPLIKRHIFGQVAFLAPFPGEPRLLRRIEGALAQHFRSNPDASSLLPNDIRYFVRNATEAEMTLAVTADEDVEGLPRELHV